MGVALSSVSLNRNALVARNKSSFAKSKQKRDLKGKKYVLYVAARSLISPCSEVGAKTGRSCLCWNNYRSRKLHCLM